MRVATKIASLIMYSRAMFEHVCRDSGYTYRKIFFQGLFCMGKRVDLRRLIQSKTEMDRLCTDLVVMILG